MTARATRFAILGDIHANLEALEAVLQDARDQGCTQFACVGDLVGYNANPRECLQLIREMGMPCIKGNHDEYAASDVVLDCWNPRATAAILWTRSKLDEEDKQWLRDLQYVRTVEDFTMVHASLDAPDRWGYVFDRFGAAASLSYQTTTVCFNGHTHLPQAFWAAGDIGGGSYSRFQVESGRRYLVNVGSVGEPRDGSALAAYVVYGPEEGTIELRRVPYDVARTEAKLLEQGLPIRRRRPQPASL